MSTVGLAEDLVASGMWPHEYRATRYAQSEIARRSSVRILDDCWIVHVIRDPYLRAVSSYRHAVATGYADKRFAVLGSHRFDRRSGFSFSQYLDYLESIDLSRANIHHKVQRHRIEAIKPADRVINISRQNLTAELNRVERERDMPQTDFEMFGELLTREREQRSKIPHAPGDTSDLALNAAAANGLSPWPDYQQFLNPATRRRIERLYAPDFEAFGAYL